MCWLFPGDYSNNDLTQRHFYDNPCVQIDVLIIKIRNFLTPCFMNCANYQTTGMIWKKTKNFRFLNILSLLKRDIICQSQYRCATAIKKPDFSFCWFALTCCTAISLSWQPFVLFLLLLDYMWSLTLNGQQFKEFQGVQFLG